jgi:hypothetical protein
MCTCKVSFVVDSRSYPAMNGEYAYCAPTRYRQINDPYELKHDGEIFSYSRRWRMYDGKSCIVSSRTYSDSPTDVIDWAPYDPGENRRHPHISVQITVDGG